MYRKTCFIAAIMFFIAASLASAYLLKGIVPLKDALMEGASGEATVEKLGRMPGERVLGIDVYRLKPNSVYSVWFVNEGPDKQTAPVGIGTNHFRTDGTGNGRYVTSITEYYIDRWRYLVINLHPDNDPKNTKDMVTVLKGDLKYGYHS